MHNNKFDNMWPIQLLDSDRGGFTEMLSPTFRVQNFYIVGGINNIAEGTRMSRLVFLLVLDGEMVHKNKF